ncbi:MAG: TonB-dependent receptor, partial [Gammaproteobacteria bacterium]
RLSPSRSGYDFGALRIGYDFESMQLISETAYIRKVADNFFDGTSRWPAVPGVPTQAQVDTSDSDTWSQELRLVSNDAAGSRWQWVTGVAAWRQDLYYKLQVPMSAPLVAMIPGLGELLTQFPGLGSLFADDGSPSLANLETDVSVDEIAWFGDVTRLLGERWELSLGGRLYRTTSGGAAKQSGLALFAVNGEPEYVIDDEIREQGFNPKLSLLWNASDNVLAYAAASRGFRVGGIQPGFAAPGSAPAPETFKSDTLWNYELGVRTQWFDNMLRFDVTGFRADWEDPQTFQLDSQGLGVYIDNAGGVESTGVEAALQTVLPFGLTLTAAAAYVDTVTTEPFVASDRATVPPGARWPFAPEWQTAASLVQLLPLGDWLFSIGATHTYLSEAPVSLAPSQFFEVFGFEQWDLQLGAKNPAVAWMPELSVTLNNLTDERGITHYWRSGTVDTVDATYIRPRALTVRLSGRF